MLNAYYTLEVISFSRTHPHVQVPIVIQNDNDLKPANDHIIRIAVVFILSMKVKGPT